MNDPDPLESMLAGLRALCVEAVRRTRFTHESRTRALQWIALASWRTGPDVLKGAEQTVFESVFEFAGWGRSDATSAIGWLLRATLELRAADDKAARYSIERCLDAVGRVFVLSGTRHESVKEFMKWATTVA